MAAVRVYVVIACIGFALINFTVLWNEDIKQWLLPNMYNIKSTGSYATNNMTSAYRNNTSLTSNKIYTTTSKTYVTNNTMTQKPPRQACINFTCYEQYRKISNAKNITLHIIPKYPAQGRLGNQMYKYASLLGIARAQGRRMLYDPNTDVVKTFKVTNIGVNTSSENWPVIKEMCLFDEELMNLPTHDVTIDGYLQSFCYFAAVSEEVRQEFTFHDSIANAAANILRDVYIKYNSSMIVGVHVRRGDLLLEKHIQQGIRVPEKSYFMKAFSLMKSKFPGRNVTFLVASDDLKWCQENLLGKDVSIMPPASAAVHLAVLSSCDHVIISGGTFGWWAGWLANGYGIYYEDSLQKGTPLADWFGRRDLVYPSVKWTALRN